MESYLDKPASTASPQRRLVSTRRSPRKRCAIELMGCHNEYQPSIAPRRIFMAAIGCAFAAALFAYHPVAGAQQADGAAAHPIIVFAQEHAADASASLSALTAEQAATLETIQSDPAASGIRIGRSVPTAIAAALDARALSMVVPAPSASGASPETADAVIAFTGVDVEHSGEDLVSFYARDDATDSEVALVVQGPDVLGSIRRGAEDYKVHPLGDGLTAVYRYDTSQLRQHPPNRNEFMRKNESMHRQAPQAPDAPPPGAAGTSGAATDTGDVIDLLVAYTPAARSAAGNIDAFIQFAIDNTHRIYRNSNIGFRLRLVHKHQVNYTQHSNMGVDLDRLTGIDGTMDEVHGLRDRYGADLVALIVGRSSNGTCGIAWIPDFGQFPDRDLSRLGFSVTAHNCETATKHTFAHELGHNQSADHDPENSLACTTSSPCSNPQFPPPPTFPYRYGRCNTAEGWNTTMSYQRSTQGDCQREIEYFSSPTLNYRGTPTGDTARRDNRRVLLETARFVANYRQSGNTGGGTGYVLPYILAERTAGREGFVRIVNRSAQAGAVTLTAIDDAGRNAGTETLNLAANGAIHFRSRDLERGNVDKDLSGVGPGTGHWRLVLTSSLDIQPLAYVRTADGFVTRIDAVEAEAEGSANRYVVHFFNPGRNRNQRSYLRLINPGSAGARITIDAHDDAGTPRGPVSLDLSAGQARHLTVGELETGGDGFDGRLGTGSGKWRLTVTATQPVQVMSLLQTPTGHLTNLSGVPAMTDVVTPPLPPTTPAADLVVLSPSVSDSSLDAGQVFTLRATVLNQGDGQSAATTLRWYRSSDATISTADTLVGTDPVRGLSAFGDQSRFDDTMTAPSSAGTYYYGACVDAVTGEPNIDNNCSSGVRVTVTVLTPPARCGVGYVLSAGETCRYEGGGSRFTISVSADGSQVCLGGICAGGSLRFNGFVVEKTSSGGYEIVALPSGVMPVDPSPTGCMDEATFSAFVSGKRLLTSFSEVRFTGGNRFRETIFGEGSYSGSYTYRKTGPNTARMQFSYDDGDRCTSSISCTSPTEGTASFTCTSGESGSTPWRIVSTGDAARRDNRRVLLETARFVANYRQSGNTGGGTGYVLPYILAERTAGREGFVRIVNRSAQAGAVTLTAIDDAGHTAGTETLSLAANGAFHFRSRDLERGNADKGLSGVGAGTGHWRLVLTSSLDIQPLAYVRTADGFVTRIDAVEAEAEGSANRYVVHFFNPGRNRNQRSYLRLINPGSADARITIDAHDDAGTPRGPVSLDLPAGQARHLTVGELETGGDGFDGRLGTGSGKWRLTVAATQPVQVMSLLQTPTGHLTNLSGVPAMTDVVTPPLPPSTTPDLVVQSPSVSDSSLDAGQAFTLRATVHNQGDGQSAATTLRWYRSSDATISTADTRVGTDAVRGLSASGTSPESISLTAPSSAGTYYYGACVDAVSGESNTANNCSSGIGVTVGSTVVNCRIPVDSSSGTKASYCNTYQNRRGAIATGWVDGDDCRRGYGWYWATDWFTRSSAESAVLSGCRSRGLAGCKVLTSFNYCGAIAYGYRESTTQCRLAGGYGTTRSAAERAALSRCQSRNAEMTSHAEEQSGNTTNFLLGTSKPGSHSLDRTEIGEEVVEGRHGSR